MLRINLGKRSKACDDIAETSFRYPKLAFYMIVRAEVFIFVKNIEYLTNSVITLKTFFFILTYYANTTTKKILLIKNIF